MRMQQVITVVGVHAEGEVGRVVTGGVIPPRAGSMFECQQAFQRQHDHLRGMLLSDPRGSVNAAVNIVTPPISAEADFGMIVIESDYYPPMSGSNLMCTVTAVLDAVCGVQGHLATDSDGARVVSLGRKLRGTRQEGTKATRFRGSLPAVSR